MNERPPLRIGTRASKLARWQSNWVAGQLRALNQAVEIVEVTTSGDVQQQGSVASLGLQGVFTKEIQAALVNGRVDVAVHSLKDLPTQSEGGTTIAAVPPREDPADALVTAHAASLGDLAVGAQVGTGSLRRRAQLLALRPDLQVTGIRGNVDTRLRKLDGDDDNHAWDAIVLAAAGLRRLGWEARITELLAPPRMLPAPGQGALAIECRADDGPTIELLAQVDDSSARAGVTAERAMLAALDGGCSAPIAAWARIESGLLLLDGLVASLDGKTVLRAAHRGNPTEAETIGNEVAEELKRAGATAIVQSARAHGG